MIAPNAFTQVDLVVFFSVRSATLVWSEASLIL
jgi:hypothetical protein